MSHLEYETRSVFQKAVRAGDLRAVEGMLAAAASSGGFDVTDDPHGEGFTALHTAASTGQLACLKALLRENRPERMFRASCSYESCGSTALYRAAVGGHAACVEALLQAGARKLEHHTRTQLQNAEVLALLGAYGVSW